MNKKNFSSVCAKLNLAFPALGLVTAVAYFLAMKFDFEYDIEHFVADSVWFWVFTVSAIAAVLLAAVLALIPGKTVAVVKAPAPTALSLFATILSIIMAIGVFISEIGAEAPALGNVQKIGTILTLFIPVSLGLYCEEKYRCTALQRLTALLAAVAVNLTMFARYFDFSNPLNGPIRNVTTILHCAVLLFLLSELRLSFGISSKKVTTVFYVFSSAAASSVALGFALGGLVYNIISHESGNPNESILRLGLYLAVALVANDRLFTLTKVTGEVKTEQN